MKPTPAQRRLLEAVRDGARLVHVVRAVEDYWDVYLPGRLRRGCTAQARAALREGWIEPVDRQAFRHGITKAGLAALEDGR